MSDVRPCFILFLENRLPGPFISDHILTSRRLREMLQSQIIFVVREVFPYGQFNIQQERWLPRA